VHRLRVPLSWLLLALNPDDRAACTLGRRRCWVEGRSVPASPSQVAACAHAFQRSAHRVDDDWVIARIEQQPRTRRLAPWPVPTALSRTWTARYALKTYVAMWVVLLAIGLLLLAFGLYPSFGVGALITETVLLGLLLPLWRRGALRSVRDLGLRPVPGARSVILVFLGLLAYGWISELWLRTLRAAPTGSNFAGISHESTAAIMAAGFVACVGAPVVEEIFFRGFLYRSLRNRLPVVPACLIAAVLFGLVHTQYPVSGKLVIVSFGVIAALLYERTGSLFPGIAMHSFVDASGFEWALRGNSSVVVSVFLILAVVLLARPPLKALGRLLTGRPVLRYYPVPEVAAGEPPGLHPQQLTLFDEHPRRETLGQGGRRERAARIAAVVCALTLLLVVVGDVHVSVRSQGALGSPGYPGCEEAGIDSAGGNEGTCVEGPATSLTTVTVVDRARVLQTPEYRVRLLEAETSPTRVSNASEHASYYPGGEGQLVSYMVALTNTESQPFQFGPGTRFRMRASYAPRPAVELALPELSGGLVTTYPPIIDGRGAPVPSLLQRPPIAPGQTRTGWISFIAPAWAQSVITRPGADVDFYRVNGEPGYRGAIRLWK
jgi:membrane protease YdiL (CAAX protease family)